MFKKKKKIANNFNQQLFQSNLLAAVVFKELRKTFKFFDFLLMSNSSKTKFFS